MACKHCFKEAAKSNIRCIDQDLNRSFNIKRNMPKNHETKLAKKVLRQCKADVLLDVHTHSNPERFALISENNYPKLARLVGGLNLKSIIIIPPHVTGKRSLIENVDCSVSIETGEHNSLEAGCFAKASVYRVLKYLSNQYIYEKDTPLLKAREFIYNNTNREITLPQNVKNFLPLQAGRIITSSVTIAEDCIPILISPRAKPKEKIFLSCEPFGGEKYEKI